MTVAVFGYLVLISVYCIFLRFKFCFFFLVLVWIEKIHQTLKTVFDHNSKNHVRRSSVFGLSQCLEMLANMVFRV